VFSTIVQRRCAGAVPETEWPQESSKAVFRQVGKMQSGDGNFPPEHHTCGCGGCSDACFQMPENEHSAQTAAEAGTAIRHTPAAKKVGNEKIAFSWNLRGGAQTQGQTAPRKEIPLH
jgi:hypothetical protein